jgi:Tat protein translocase TatC
VTKNPEQFKMSFSDHLEELRRRITVCLLALLVGTAVAYGFRNQLFSFILHPLFEARQSAQAMAPNQEQPPATPAELANEANELAQQALATQEPAKAAQLAARAASLAARAAEGAAEDRGGTRPRADRDDQPRFIAYTNPVKPFWVSLQLALVGGICLAFGVILWEIWSFIAPGLYPQEKKYALPFVTAATLCFVGGAGFGYRYVFPLGFAFLTRFSRGIANAQGIDMMDVTTVDSFVSIALKMLLAFGLVFELPVVISLLSLAGIVNHRQLWHFGRWFIVIAVSVGALLTPPDVISQVMMAVPLSLLYLLSIGLAYFLHPDRRTRKKPPAQPAT